MGLTGTTAGRTAVAVSTQNRISPVSSAEVAGTLKFALAVAIRKASIPETRSERYAES